MEYTKATPGTTCNIVDDLGAEWMPVINSSVNEAFCDGDTHPVAYTDATGWYVRTDIIGD